MLAPSSTSIKSFRRIRKIYSQFRGFCTMSLRRCGQLCYILIMREWMRERMRRRSKRGPNTSESTGKIGQEIPANQPAPLRPSYPEAQSQAAGHADDDPRDEVSGEPSGVFADAGDEPEDVAAPEEPEVSGAT